MNNAGYLKAISEDTGSSAADLASIDNHMATLQTSLTTIEDEVGQPGGVQFEYYQKRDGFPLMAYMENSAANISLDNDYSLAAEVIRYNPGVAFKVTSMDLTWIDTTNYVARTTLFNTNGSAVNLDIGVWDSALTGLVQGTCTQGITNNLRIINSGWDIIITKMEGSNYHHRFTYVWANPIEVDATQAWAFQVQADLTGAVEIMACVHVVMG